MRRFWLYVGLGVLGTVPAIAAERPNIVLVFIDDMGWGDFSCFGNREVTTEHIDRLAAEGIRFEQFYVNSPICSPSRTAISTGQYPQRWGIGSYLASRKLNQARGIAQWLDPNAPMLARSLHEAGYATGHFGKWHMGGQRDVDNAPPISAYGFDASLTNFEGMGPKLLPLTLRPGETEPGKIWAGGERLGGPVTWMLRSKITGGFVQAALAFMDEAQRQGRPFYVNVWPDDVHSPYWPPVDRWGDGAKHDLYNGVLDAADEQLAVLFDHIRSQPDLRDNTLILVCSDNGPEPDGGRAGPLRGHKTQLYEGGIRSPLVVWGPRWIGPGLAGRVNRDSWFAAVDLVPSLLQVAGVPLPAQVRFDGEDLHETLLGRAQASRTAPLCFRRPPDRDAFYGVADLPDLAVRHGRWKLLCEYDGTHAELYDLLRDPGETTNRAALQPGVTRTLVATVLAWHKRLPADRGPTYQTPQPR